MELPRFFLSKEGRADRDKRERIAELTSQKNELLRKKVAALERKAQIEGWPGDRGDVRRNEQRDDGSSLDEIDRNVAAIDDQIRSLEAETNMDHGSPHHDGEPMEA